MLYMTFHVFEPVLIHWIFIGSKAIMEIQKLHVLCNEHTHKQTDKQTNGQTRILWTIKLEVFELVKN